MVVVVVVTGRVVAVVAGGGATVVIGAGTTAAGAPPVVVVVVARSRHDLGSPSSSATSGAAVVGLVVATGMAAGTAVVDVVEVDDELAVTSSAPSNAALEPALPTEDTRQTPTATSATTVTTIRPFRSRSSGLRWRSRRRSSRMTDESPSRFVALPLPPRTLVPHLWLPGPLACEPLPDRQWVESRQDGHLMSAIALLVPAW